MKSEHLVYTVMSPAITAFDRAFRSKFQAVVADVQKASGQAAVKQLKAQLGKRFAASQELGFKVNAPPAIKGWEFDATNPKAKRWVEDHTADLLDDLNQATRDAIRDLVDRSFDGEFDVHDLADEIADLIGDDARAETIARTETMTASNQGQTAAWDQAIEEGFLTGRETKEWIVTPDDRLCPLCEPMDGQNVPMSDNFVQPETNDQVDAPPLHPRCRCTVGLTL